MLSDAEYGKVLDNIVIACVDVVIMHKNEILIEQRSSDPIKNEWWIFGGRMQANETFQETAQRGILRELSLNIEDKSRFKELLTLNLRWPTRRELPVTNGCHHLLIAHQINISNEERAVIDKNTSNQRIEWFDVDVIRSKDILPELRLLINAIKKVEVYG